MNFLQLWSATMSLLGGDADMHEATQLADETRLRLTALYCIARTSPILQLVAAAAAR